MQRVSNCIQFSRVMVWILPIKLTAGDADFLPLRPFEDFEDIVELRIWIECAKYFLSSSLLYSTSSEQVTWRFRPLGVEDSADWMSNPVQIQVSYISRKKAKEPEEKGYRIRLSQGVCIVTRARKYGERCERIWRSSGSTLVI